VLKALCQEVDFSDTDKALLGELLPYGLAGTRQCSGGAALIP
jgi:hypothetical protein